MVEHAADLRAVRKNGSIERQTHSDRNRSKGDFWVLYTWGNPNWELHVHYNNNSKINDKEIKVVGNNNKGGEYHVYGDYFESIRRYIRQ